MNNLTLQIEFHSGAGMSVEALQTSIRSRVYNDHELSHSDWLAIKATVGLNVDKIEYLNIHRIFTYIERGQVRTEPEARNALLNFLDDNEPVLPLLKFIDRTVVTALAAAGGALVGGLTARGLTEPVAQMIEILLQGATSGTAASAILPVATKSSQFIVARLTTQLIFRAAYGAFTGILLLGAISYGLSKLD